jgi:hypothetical protein
MSRFDNERDRRFAPQASDEVESELLQELSAVKLKLQLAIDAINTLDSAMRGTFDLLVARELLTDNAKGVRDYEKAMDSLRRAGLYPERKEGAAPTGVSCPKCKSQLRVKGEPGDRCEWCGHEF